MTQNPFTSSSPTTWFMFYLIRQSLFPRWYFYRFVRHTCEQRYLIMFLRVANLSKRMHVFARRSTLEESRTNLCTTGTHKTVTSTKLWGKFYCSGPQILELGSNFSQLRAATKLKRIPHCCCWIHKLSKETLCCEQPLYHCWNLFFFFFFLKR